MPVWQRLTPGYLRQVGALVTALLFVTACGGGSSAGPTSATEAPATTEGVAATDPGGAAEGIELDVEIDTTTSTAPPGPSWEIGGTVTATGPLEGTFDFDPWCDIRKDSEGEFLNVAFGYEDRDDAEVPTVRIVVHVREWRDQGDFETSLEAQYQTGSGFDLTLDDAAGAARLSLALLDKAAGADVLQIALQGDFDGAVAGTVDADLVCYAG